MIKAHVPVLLAATLSASSAMAAFMPGKWQHQTTLLTAQVPGIPQWLIRLMAGHGTRSSCNSAARLDSHPEDLFKGDDTAVCTLHQLSIADGRIAYDTFCSNRRFPQGLLVSSRGTYTPTSYAIATVSSGTQDGKPVRITTQGSGRWVSGTCDRP